MLNWLVYYLIFVVVISVIVAVIIWKLHLKSPLRLLITLFILIVSPVVISYAVMVYFNPLPETMVPDLIGKSISEAEEVIDILDLKLKVESKAGDSDIVSFQRPEEGRIVKVGRTILVTLGNKLPQEEAVPSSFEGEVESEQILMEEEYDEKKVE